MNARSLLVGSERGAAHAVALAALATGVAALVRPRVAMPTDPAAVSLWTTLGVAFVAAVLVATYGGGLLAAWVTVGVPAIVSSWLWTGVGGPLADPAVLDWLSWSLRSAAGTALVLGTAGFLVGRLLDAVWTRRPGAHA